MRINITYLVLSAVIPAAANLRDRRTDPGDFAVMKSMREFMPKASTGMIIGLVIFTAAAIGAIALYEYYKNSEKKDTLKKKSRAEFNKGLFSKGLTEPERNTLKSMVKQSALEMPDRVLENIKAFEEVIDSTVKYFESKGTQDDFNDDLLIIGSIRDKLGFRNLSPDCPLVSTRELAPGQPCSIALGGSGVAGYGTFIQNVNEMEFSIKPLGGGSGPGVAVSSGEKLNFSLIRAGDAEYHFGVNVRRIDGSGAIVCGHSTDLKRKQLREFVRMDIRVPVNMRIIHSENEDSDNFRNAVKLTGRTVDISGGGIKVALEQKMDVNDIVVMSFKLFDYQFRGFKARVLRNYSKAAPDGDGEMFYHHMQFLDLENQDRERIIKGIFERQRTELQWR
ncbi:MAG: flagellar brake protein [Fibrobacterota bacterium]